MIAIADLALGRFFASGHGGISSNSLLRRNAEVLGFQVKYNRLVTQLGSVK